MSIVDGVFAETELLAIRMKADALRFDDRVNKQYVPRTMDTVNAISRVQTANVTPLQSRAKDFVVEVEWFNACEVVAQDCVPCTVGGHTGSTNVEQYQIDRCKEVPFTVNHHTLATNDFSPEEATAKLMLTAEARLVEQVVLDYLTTVYASGGVNHFTMDAEATVVGNETRVDHADYDAEFMIPHLVKVANYNQFVSPVMLSGNVLYSDWLNSKYVQNLAMNFGDNNRFATMDWFWDLWNFDQLGISDHQILVSTGATAFASRPMYDISGIEDWGKEGKRWSRPSAFMPNLWIDWSRNTDCSNDRLVENYKAKARWANMVNPIGCNEDNTGILVYRRMP